MSQYLSQDDYIQSLNKRAQFPAGFYSSTVPVEFFPVEKESKKPYQMKLSLLGLKEPTSRFGAVFTKNQFPGAPVIVGRLMLEHEAISGIVINNRIANVCAANGVPSAKRICSEVESLFEFSSGSIIPSSTGIIGWSLPVEEMIQAASSLKEVVEDHSILPLSKAIMTTDSFPKVRSIEVGEGRITAIVKGAGMIEPNMATMLGFITTDISLERDELRQLLQEAVDASFNRISVDGDQSTSDSVFLLSSGCKPAVDRELFRSALIQICKQLAQDVVRNGEGTSHVMHVKVNGFESNEIAQKVAKAVLNSPLVKTAIFGNDPNVGRFLSALGDYCGNHNIFLNSEKLSLHLGDEVVFNKGDFLLDEKKEERLFHYLKECSMPQPSLGFPPHEKRVEIRFDLEGGGVAEAFGSDLSYDYVRENAEYRS